MVKKPNTATIFGANYFPGLSKDRRAELIRMIVDHIADWHGFKVFDFEKKQLVRFLVDRPYNWAQGDQPYTYYVVRAKNWLTIHQKSLTNPESLPELRRRYTFIWERVKRHTVLS